MAVLEVDSEFDAEMGIELSVPSAVDLLLHCHSRRGPPGTCSTVTALGISEQTKVT